ncbi:transpeptidase [SAR11 cluster bacterium PRT-SC02]|nr:transpeptidase [SAR11 cluster bacterium PRT-SC02]|tara:strand:+ start:157 stop:648 length:492 start_codon:yes stop_codon:yes gene_type:complete
MHIILKNKFLIYNDYKLKCAIGKRGIKHKKREGDKSTPKGLFKLKYVLYRKDKIKKPKTALKTKILKRNMGWCDDIRSKHYNKLIKFPFRWRAEKLYRSDNTYNIVVVLDYNMKPIVKGKGSAVFIHLSKNNYSPTLGCISLNLKDLYLLLSLVKKRVYLKIN